MKTLIQKILRVFLLKPQAIWYARSQTKYANDLSFTQAASRFPRRNDLHAYMHHYFYRLCSSDIVEHRAYFKKYGRGFGEDAFHAMWFALIREFRPQRCLEIGVYRGQIISLWALIARKIGLECDIHGISPFTSSGDNVSVYLRNIDYLSDTLQNHSYFGLPAPVLVSALSTDPIAVDHSRKNCWDLIYIDGNHDYEVALADYQNCCDILSDGGLLVMDDSSLYSDYRPPIFSFAGHPGPSRVVQELAMKELIFIGAVGHNNIFMKKARP
jgi:hypothetical protein